MVGGVSVCPSVRPFRLRLLSLVAPLLCRACRWGARRLLRVCSGSMGGCASVHPSRCAQSCLGLVAGAVGGDSGGILLEDSMQALNLKTNGHNWEFGWGLWFGV